MGAKTDVKFRDRLRATGCSATQIAEQCGARIRSVYYWLEGKRTPSRMAQTLVLSVLRETRKRRAKP